MTGLIRRSYRRWRSALKRTWNFQRNANFSVWHWAETISPLGIVFRSSPTFLYLTASSIFFFFIFLLVTFVFLRRYVGGLLSPRKCSMLTKWLMVKGFRLSVERTYRTTGTQRRKNASITPTCRVSRYTVDKRFDVSGSRKWRLRLPDYDKDHKFRVALKIF